MNISKTLGKFFGRSKRNKDRPIDEESGFHEMVNIGDTYRGQIYKDKEVDENKTDDISPVGFAGDFLQVKKTDEVKKKSLETLHEQTKPHVEDKKFISPKRIFEDFKFEHDSNDLPSAYEVRRRLLEADRVHKLWKLRRRFKMAGKELTDDIWSKEIDLSGPHKWDSIINKPPLERYILMIEYIRKLAAKEAKESGHFGIITSETTDKQFSRLHKKLRLDFTLNTNGIPSNICLGEDSSEEEQYFDFKWKNMSTFKWIDSSQVSVGDNLISLKQTDDYLTPTPSLNILRELNRNESTQISYSDSNSSICSESNLKEYESNFSTESIKSHSSISDRNESNIDSDQDSNPRVIFNVSNVGSCFSASKKI
ncbi:hypothetical protein O3M35_013083 [Rhynocoris fuscipes]|uniref:Uncharacterized protein n=1 Tax=Rhynocoris fuscipes TaxID=488301 RepID=A0AAW1CKA8_9HEMI